MSTGGLPLMTMLKTRMQWHQARQKVIAENVANADTPNFKPKDLREPSAKGPGGAADFPGLVRTSAAHMAGSAAGDAPGTNAAKRFEATPSGNAVVLEDEMLKAAQNQSDYQMAVTLYAKSLSLLKTAIGRRG